MESRVCIILVNYNTYEDTVECIDSLSSIQYDNYKIIVVDNDSNDREKFEQLLNINRSVDFIFASNNGGFSYGNNVGIKFAERKYKPDFFLLLNNDTIVEHDFLTKLVDAASLNRDNFGMATGRICYYSDHSKIDFRGGDFDEKRGIALYRKIADEPESDIVRITFATGCLLLIHRNTIKRVGLLDEAYFMYGEDTDYTCRVIKNGLDVLYCDDAVVYHKISASCGINTHFNQYYMERNDLINIKKYSNSILFSYIYNMKRCIMDIILNKRNIKPIIRAWKDFLLRKKGKSEYY